MTKPINPTARHPITGTSSTHRFHCHAPKCGRAFKHEPGAGLFCSPRCEKAHAKHMEQLAEKLLKAGFTRNAKAPNVFTKQKVSITLEQVKFHGYKETLAQHAAALR